MPTNVGNSPTYYMEVIELDTKDKVRFLIKWGMSAAKIGEPLHRSTISKWLNGTGTIAKEREEEIERKLQQFKEEVNNIL